MLLVDVENYTQGKNVEEPWERERIPIEGLPEKFLWMKVKPGSKLRNLLALATDSFINERVVLWTGSGSAVIKAISCAEIMKRKFNDLHQITRICFRKKEEIWEPRTEGLDDLVVEREIPTIHIMLSKDPLDSNALGYQAPGDWNGFCGQEYVSKEKKKCHFKKGKQYKSKDKRSENAEGSMILGSPSTAASEIQSQSFYSSRNRKRKQNVRPNGNVTTENKTAEENAGKTTN